jgi:molybdenum cofactor cytidylyltransferase
MNTNLYSAIILAAGLSSRMGKFKPQLPIGGQSILEQAIAVFQHSGIKDIQVVLGYRAKDLIKSVNDSEANWCINSCYHEGMFSSVKTGVEHISPNSVAFMVLPVDIPLVSPKTISALIKTHEMTNQLIVHPVRNGKRGHPPLISSALVKNLLQYQRRGGLKSFLTQYLNSTAEVSVSDQFIHLDMDTHEDYQELVNLYNTRMFQDRSELLQIEASDV